MIHFPTFRKWLELLGRSTFIKRLSLRAASPDDSSNGQPANRSSIRIAPWKISAFNDSNARKRTELSLLQLMRSSLVNDQDLSDALKAFAEDNRLLIRSDIRHFAECVRSNSSLASSVEMSPALFGKDTTMVLRMGELDGSLQSSLDNLIETKRADLELEHSRHQALTYNYFIPLTIIYPILTGLYLFFIHPTLLKMGNEFNEVVKPTTLRNLELVQHAHPYILLICLILFLLITFERFRLFILNIANNLGWYRAELPAGISNDRLLSSAIGASKSLKSTLAGIAKFHPSASARQKYLVASNDIELATPTWTALKNSRLITTSDEKYLFDHDGPQQSNIESQKYLFKSKYELARLSSKSKDEKVSILIQYGLLLFFGSIVLLFAYTQFEFIYSIPFGIPTHD